MKSRRRPRAVFPWKEVRAVGKFMLAVRALTKCISEHPAIFVSPDPPLATVNNDVDALEQAQAVANTHVTGAAAARDIVYDKVIKDVRGLLRYITRLADAEGNEAKAIAIIEASGFRLRKKAVHVKSIFTAKHGDIEGQVLLRAKSFGRRVSYLWQVSLDKKEWNTTAMTLVANCKVQCRPGMRIFFRLHAISHDGSEHITDAVSIFVK